MRFDPILMPIYPHEAMRILNLTTDQYEELVRLGELQRSWVDRERPTGDVRPHTFIDLVEATRAQALVALAKALPEPQFEDFFDAMVQDAFLNDWLYDQFWSPVDGHLDVDEAVKAISLDAETLADCDKSSARVLLDIWDDLERKMRKVIFEGEPDRLHLSEQSVPVKA